MVEDSLAKRYFSKLTSKGLGILLSLVTVGVIPKALGPEAYGNVGFLTNFFKNLIKFLKFGVPTAYFTKISKRPEEKNIIVFYLYYVLFVLFILLILLVLSFKIGFDEIIWPDQKKIFVLLACAMVVANFIINSLSQTVDAYGLTFKYEFFTIIKTSIYTILIILLAKNDLLNIENYFFLNIFLLITLSIIGFHLLYKNRILIFDSILLKKNEFFSYFKEFYSFSHPLFVYSIVVFLISFFDRWILQYFYGSREQGLYTLAITISSMIYLVSSQGSQLILREMSIASKEKSNDKIKEVLEKFLPIFFVISIYFAAFISINSTQIILIIWGDQFKNAQIIVSFIVFNTAFQTVNLFAGNVLFAKDKTLFLRNVGSITIIFSFFISLILMLPAEYGGFKLGALGLSIKIVLYHFLIGNISLLYCSRILKFNFIKHVYHQFSTMIILLLFSFGSMFAVARFSQDLYFSFLINGVLYTALTVLLILKFPTFFMFNQKDLDSLSVNALNMYRLLKTKLF